ncbi:unknown (plasmid) [Haloarcula marismortui ATCC 43049]|uniref:Uncharacterized protein n=1 Tax=Haloarcula marismortui (strain ATCC 43049 / DSM 3752 / JCM 8966 / VKM B-1809) TaxID=272569 RepID=Q5V886_HALMA|nr:hypothetical protein [Haloarcula marismortui]AAV44286.1 unknown [Haloarcula marismortui ATCC 43049]
MASEPNATVDRVIEIADLVADDADADAEAVLLDALGRVRKRGGTDE